MRLRCHAMRGECCLFSLYIRTPCKLLFSYINIHVDNATQCFFSCAMVALQVFFLGYMVHKLLMCSLGRLEEDDRDHYGKGTKTPRAVSRAPCAIRPWGRCVRTITVR